MQKPWPSSGPSSPDWRTDAGTACTVAVSIGYVLASLGQRVLHPVVMLWLHRVWLAPALLSPWLVRGWTAPWTPPAAVRSAVVDGQLVSAVSVGGGSSAVSVTVPDGLTFVGDWLLWSLLGVGLLRVVLAG